MNKDRVQKAFIIAFVLFFFAYLFGPLIVMGITAFNTSGFPRVAPWDCFSVEWFNVLINDARLMTGLRNSVIIGLGVVLLAVPVGLAGAIMLMQAKPRIRPWYYTITIAPILVPGVVLGISTLLFWDRIGIMLGASEGSIFYNGVFLTIIGQATFISAYAMLIFIARLQRFDPVQEEAALDLGASHTQVFRKILLPFLKPAIGSAAVLAFLASFENYNTTIFTIVSSSTLTTVLASKVRYGIDASISALAVSIVALTLIGAVILEISQRRQARKIKSQLAVARGKVTEAKKLKSFFVEPAFLMVLAVVIAGVGAIFLTGTIGVEECKVAVKEQRQVEIRRKVERRQLQQMFQQAIEMQGKQPATREQKESPTVERVGTESYQGIFAPQNLQDQVGDEAEEEVVPEGVQTFQSIFAPENLQEQVDSNTNDSQY